MAKSPSFDGRAQLEALLRAADDLAYRDKKRADSQKHAESIHSYRKQKGRMYGRRWESVRRFVLNRDDATCRICGESEIVVLEIHHITAVAHGGLDLPDNLITLCANHHRLAQRGEYTPEHLRSLIGGQPREPTDEELIAWMFARHARSKRV